QDTGVSYRSYAAWTLWLLGYPAQGRIQMDEALALAQEGQAKEGIEQLTQGLTAWRATGAKIHRSYFLTLLANVHGTIGEPEAGLTVLTEVLTFAETAGEHWYEAELHRLKGALLLQQNS